MSYDTQCELLAEHFLSDQQHTPEQVADLAQTIQDAVDGWFTVNEPSPKLGVVAAVKRALSYGPEHERHWMLDINGISAETSCALRETTHDSAADTCVMKFCTNEDPVIRRIYREGE